MIEGAIIGAVVGMIFAVVMLLRRRRFRNDLLALIAENRREEARALLDRKIQPTKKVTISKLVGQRERMAGLTMLGDLDTLEEEVSDHHGPLTAEVQVDAIGLLGIAIRSVDPSDAARRLSELATRMETEGGRTMKLVKRKTRALAALAAGLKGEDIPSQHRLTLDSFEGDGGMVQILIWQALSLALLAAGQEGQARGLRKKVLALTRAFED